MSNRLRFRSGQVELHKVRVDSATQLEAGDLVWLDTDDVKPASAFAWTTALATTQANFANVFAGVIHQPSAVGETDPVSIDLSPLAVYEFDVVADTFELGGLLGVDGAPSALVDQRLAKVSAASHSPPATLLSAIPESRGPTPCPSSTASRRPAVSNPSRWKTSTRELRAAPAG